MRRLLILAFILSPLLSTAREHFSFLSSVVVLEDSLDAAQAVRKSDEYTSGLTPFDLAIRLHKAEGGTERDYLNLAARSMRSWPAAEAAELKTAFAALESKAAALNIKLALPDTVYLCKTTGKEEFGAEGYTRGDRIMLNTAAGELSAALVAHELWHVISRLNPGLRNNAYAGFGFRACNRVDYKPAFNGQVISNPDCPFIENYMRINKDGTDQYVAIVLYSRSPYVQGGGLMDYVGVGLLALDGDDKHKRPVMRAGKPLVYEFSECPDFFRQAGRNTGYMLHIEELTAEHFAALMTGRKLKQPEFVDRLGAALR